MMGNESHSYRCLNRNLMATCFELNRAQCLQDVIVFRDQKEDDYSGFSVANRLNLHLSFLTCEKKSPLHGHPKT